MRLALAAAVSLALSFPALAMMAPQYYEQARDEAANVVIIAVESVDPAEGGIGSCGVHGTVETVERGTLYTVGETVTIWVDCLDPSTEADVPVGGTIWQDFESLASSKRGKAWMNEYGGIVLSQYEQMD